MTTKLTHPVVTFSLPIGGENVTSQNIEVADAKGSRYHVQKNMKPFR